MNIVIVFEAICDCKVGVPYEVLQLAIALKQGGHNILCLKGSRNLEADCLKEAKAVGIEICNLSLVDGRKIRRVLGAFKPDLAHVFCTMIPLNFIVSQQLVRMQIPFVFEPHGSLNPQLFNMRFGGKKNAFYHKAKKKIYRWLIDSYIIRHATAFRAVSEGEAGILAAHEKYRSFVVPYAISDEWYSSISSSKHKTEKKTLFFLGRQDIYQKGLDLLLDAFAQLNRDGYGPKYEALLAGPDLTGSLEKLRKKVAAEQLNNVRICEGLYGEDKEEAFAEADLFLSPSRFEGVPKTVREAMARGIPSLVTRETNFADVCTLERCGIVSTADSHDIAKLLGDYLDGKLDLASSAEISKAAEKYSWSNIAGKVTEVYMQIADNGAE